MFEWLTCWLVESDLIYFIVGLIKTSSSQLQWSNFCRLFPTVTWRVATQSGTISQLESSALIRIISCLDQPENITLIRLVTNLLHDVLLSLALGQNAYYYYALMP